MTSIAGGGLASSVSRSIRGRRSDPQNLGPAGPRVAIAVRDLALEQQAVAFADLVDLRPTRGKI